MSDPSVFDPQSSAADLDALRQHRAALADASTEETPLMTVRLGDGDPLALPPQLGRVLAAALAEAASGHAVEVRTVADELTTQEAADLLGVSRPFVVKLVDSGELPARRVGTHRRLRRVDVLAHREHMRTTQAAALDELADQAQELGLYDVDPRMPGADGPPAAGGPPAATPA
jgi:excisionase family DNA binding protein